MENKLHQSGFIKFIYWILIKIINWFRINFTFIKHFNRLLNKVGYQLIKVSGADLFPFDIEKEFRVIFNKTDNLTQTSTERMYALFQATEYVVKKKILGDFVECGVWKGGSSMIMALTLKKNNETKRNIYLYDTFSGMSKPTEKDIGANDNTQALKFWEGQTKGEVTYWDFSPLKEVKKNLESTRYPRDKILFIKGKVEDTIPKTIPKNIALLRLDTDWYESTYHELKYLYPRLVKGGILLIDDYGHWKGAREAVDRYFRENKIEMLMHRIDYTGRIGIKI